MNLTQLAGLLAFGCGSLSCLLAGAPRLWQAIAGVNALLAAETLFGLRHMVHEGARAGLRIFLLDGGGLWLLLLLAVTVGLALGLAFALRRQLRAGSAPLLVAACLLTIAALALFAIESLSFGAVATLLYYPLRDVMMVGWLWWAIGAGISSCAFMARCGVPPAEGDPRRRTPRATFRGNSTQRA
jgi:hypothetical protein